MSGLFFALGSNGAGQLGIGHSEDVSVPKPVRFSPTRLSSPVVTVRAGGNHTLLLTRDGTLWWGGDSKSGACGAASPQTEKIFSEVKGVEKPVSLVACTWEASFFVTADGLYAMGMGMKGELGLGEMMIRSPRPDRVPDFPPQGTRVVDLAGSMAHVVVVLDNGEAYGWGNGRHGQIGEPSGIMHSPRKIDLAFKATRVACCKEATCLFGEPSSGQLRVIGSDKWSILSGALSSVPAWKDVGASWGNIYVLKQDGGLLSWGRDDHGQLPPPNMPDLKAMAIGSEHVVALSNEGDVLAWGWGEHGNCGPSLVDDIKGRWNVISSSKVLPKGMSIDVVGAGYATSWVGIRSDEQVSLETAPDL